MFLTSSQATVPFELPIDHICEGLHLCILSSLVRIQCFGDEEYEQILPYPDSSSAKLNQITINMQPKKKTQKIAAI
jgi:hypothetical protein